MRGNKAKMVAAQPEGSRAITDGTKIGIGVIGAGNFARAILLPALKRTEAKLAVVADINGVAAAHAARKFGAGKAVSDHRQILDDPAIRAAFVVVGHHLHSRFVCEALNAGKHVFVEKPLAISEAQLGEVIETYGKTAKKTMVMVGYNRRFSPHTAKIKELLAGRTEPLTMTMTVNAGFIPPEHWTQDPERGGGRIIGEGCHFIDLLSYLAGSPVTTVSAAMIGGNGPVRDDKISILLGFADGSVGTLNYFANGSKSYPKETLEVFGDGRVIRMENFRVTTGYGFKGFRSFRTWRQDKGHRREIAAFVNAVERWESEESGTAESGEMESGYTIPIPGGIGSCPRIPACPEIQTGEIGSCPQISSTLIPFEQIVNVTRASFAAVESARAHSVIRL